MGKEIITFGDNEIEKRKFLCYKNPIFKKDVHADNILISNKTSFGKKNHKYLIVYMDDDFKIKPLHIILPKMSGYVIVYDGMYFLIEGDELFKK